MADVQLSVESGIATVLINRPDALNSLSSAVMEQLEEVVGRIERDNDVAAVIVTGSGRAFVAGADIEEISTLDPESGTAFARRGQQVFTHIEQLEKPVVAAVNGFALGGGCELAMACHLRIASTKAKFGQPEVKLGIVPGFGGTQRLPRLVGRGIANQLLLTGTIISAEEALRIGLVNEVVAPEDLLARAKALLEAILANGPRAIRACLVAVRDGLELGQEAGIELEAKLFSALCGSDEMREGTQAFLEKRSPKF